MTRERPEFKGRPFGAFEGLQIEKSIDITDQCNSAPGFEVLLNYATRKVGKNFLDGKRLVGVRRKRIDEIEATLRWNFYLYTIEKGYPEVLKLAAALERDLSIKDGLLVEMILAHAREDDGLV